MEKRKPGRPKSDKPIRNKNVNFRVTEDEYKNAVKICNDNDITYADVFLKGLEFWSEK